MAAGSAVLRLLLVCWLTSAVDSSAASKAGIVAGLDPRQDGRRPLLFIAGLREANRHKQPGAARPETRQVDLVPVPPVPVPPGAARQVDLVPVPPGAARIQGRLGPPVPVLNPSWEPRMDRGRKVSPGRPRQQGIEPAPAPRSFLFNLKVPLLSSLIPKTGTSSSAKASEGGHVRPPEDQQGSLEIRIGPPGSENGAKGERNPGGNPKPSFHFNLVVPAPPAAQTPSTPTPPGTPVKHQRPGGPGLTHSSHVDPEQRYPGSQSRTWSAGSAQNPPDRTAQGVSTLFGARRLVAHPAGSGLLVHPKPQPSPFPSGEQTPLSSEQQQNPSKPLEASPGSRGSAGGVLERYRPEHGAGRPGSSGLQRPPYSPSDPRLQSSPASPPRPIPGLASGRPLQTPQSGSTDPAVQGSWGSTGPAQYGSNRQQTYDPQPLGSGLDGFRVPFWTGSGDVQQNTETYRPAESGPQTGPVLLGVRDPPGSVHGFKPVEPKPLVGSGPPGPRPPSYVPAWQRRNPNRADAKPQASSVQTEAGGSAGGSAGGIRWVQQPSAGQMVGPDRLPLWPGAPRPGYFPDAGGTSPYGTQTPPVPPGPPRRWPSGSEGTRGSGTAPAPGPGPGGPRDYNYQPGNPVPPSRFRRPPFVLHRENTASQNYDPENMVELLQKYFSHGRGTGGSGEPAARPGLPEIPTGGAGAGRNRYTPLSLDMGGDPHVQNRPVLLGSPDDDGSPEPNGDGTNSSPEGSPHRMGSAGLAWSGPHSEQVPGGFRPISIQISNRDLLVV